MISSLVMPPAKNLPPRESQPPQRVRTTMVRAARSCQPRVSASRTSGGRTRATSAVRSNARGMPITAAASIEATRIPSTVLPGLAPNSATRAR